LPDLTLCDFYLFSKLKEYLTKPKFTTDKDVTCIKNSWLKDKEQQFFNNEILPLKNAGASAYLLHQTMLKIYKI